MLGFELGGPFHRGRNGPGGWWILEDPELHFGADVLVPDLAGWRRNRLEALPATPYFTLASGRWTLVAAHDGNMLVRAEPFDAIELELGALWA